MFSCPLHTQTHVLSNAKFACHCLERACLLISENVRPRRYAYLRRLYFVVTFVFKSVSVSTSPLISTLKSISLRSCPLGQTLRRCRMFSLQPKSPLRTNSVFPSTMACLSHVRSLYHVSKVFDCPHELQLLIGCHEPMSCWTMGLSLSSSELQAANVMATIANIAHNDRFLIVCNMMCWFLIMGINIKVFRLLLPTQVERFWLFSLSVRWLFGWAVMMLSRLMVLGYGRFSMRPSHRQPFNRLYFSWWRSWITMPFHFAKLQLIW